MKKSKTAFQRIEQKNRMAAKVFGPGSSNTSDRNKKRIIDALFPPARRIDGTEDPYLK